MLNTMQSSIGEKTGLHYLPWSRRWHTATREEKNQAKQILQGMAANPSGILMYHPLGHEFALGKSLPHQFGIEALQAILVIWLLAQTRIGNSGPVCML